MIRFRESQANLFLVLVVTLETKQCPNATLGERGIGSYLDIVPEGSDQASFTFKGSKGSKNTW